MKGKITKNEIETLVDYFHNNHIPDYDGYVGMYFLPEEVMVKYREKYPNDWGSSK